MKKHKPLPVQETMCATCPYRHGSKTEFLQSTITMSALNEALRICHSAGSNNAFHKRTGKPPALCHGARVIQLKYWCATGFIDSPTEQAWSNKCKELGITNGVIP